MATLLKVGGKLPPPCPLFSYATDCIYIYAMALLCHVCVMFGHVHMHSKNIHTYAHIHTCTHRLSMESGRTQMTLIRTSVLWLRMVLISSTPRLTCVRPSSRTKGEPPAMWGVMPEQGGYTFQLASEPAHWGVEVPPWVHQAAVCPEVPPGC